MRVTTMDLTLPVVGFVLTIALLTCAYYLGG
jgi:hypothetical protein